MPIPHATPLYADGCHPATTRPPLGPETSWGEVLALIKIKRGGMSPGSGRLWFHLAKFQGLGIVPWTQSVV